MENNMLNSLKIMHQLVQIMDRKKVLQAFKQWSSLDPNLSKYEVATHLLEQSLRIEWAQRKLILKVMRAKPETLNMVFGEIAQSFEKSIFANVPNVNNKNSFLNSRHMRELNPEHLNEDSIPERLCQEFGTLVLDIYLIPIPTSILTIIKSEMRKTGLMERILNLQVNHLNEIIRLVDPTTVRFICRYKSLAPDCSIIVDRILRSNRVTIEFNSNEALSGYRGMLDTHKWSQFIHVRPNLN